MVLGRWSCRAPLGHCPSPQNAIMKAHMLVGVLVVVGFAVGKGEWGPGAGRKGMGQGPWSELCSHPSVFLSSCT